MTTNSHEEVHIPTVDGYLLNGWFYPARVKAPGVVMSPGFLCLKEMMLPQIATHFQKHNINALIYDPRGCGDNAKDGLEDLDPAQHLNDCIDVLTFLAGRSTVDAKRVGHWGVSYSGTLSLCAAAMDNRAKFVITCCPWVKYFHDDDVPKYLKMAMNDRTLRLEGGKPSTVALYDGQQVAGPFLHVPSRKGAERAYKWVSNVKRHFPSYKHFVTLQTLANLIRWSPTSLVPLLHSASILMLVPEEDQLSPPEIQMRLFDSLPGSKEMRLVKDEDHFGVLMGAEREQLLELQISFILKSTHIDDEMVQSSL